MIVQVRTRDWEGKLCNFWLPQSSCCHTAPLSMGSGLNPQASWQSTNYITHIYIYTPEKCRKELQISNTAPAAIVNLERNQVRASMSCVFHIQRKVGWQLNTLRLGKLARTLKMKLCSHFYLRTSTGPCHATSVPAQLPLLMWNSFFHLAMASTLEMHHWSPLRQPRAWTYTSHHCSYIKGYWSLLYF